MNNLGMNVLAALPSKAPGVKEVASQSNVKSSQKDTSVKDKDFENVIKSHQKPENGSDKKETIKAKETKKLGNEKSILAEHGTTIEKTNVVSEDDKEMLQSVKDIVMSMILTTLNITPEELENVLTKMEIQPLDLLNEDVFRGFIIQVQEGDLSNILMQESNMKDIGKLWEKLTGIASAFELDSIQPEEVTIVMSEESLKSDTTSTVQSLQDNQGQLSNKMTADVEIQVAPVLNVTNSKSKETSEETPEIHETGIKLEGNLPKGEFILQMPINSLEKSAGMQFWNQEQNMIQKNTAMIKDNLETQILKKIEINTLKEGKEIQMELNPRELGKLALRVTENSGVVTANIRVESEKTKEMLMQNITELKEGLEKQGLAIGEFNIDVRKESHQSEMFKQKQKSSKRIEEIIAKHLEEVEMEEVAENVISDTAIDYMA